jgi:Spy/CpxP family protein refolding chaperone
MKKKIILLAVICSVFVGVSMAVTLYILIGGRSSSSTQAASGSASHNMPPGMSHEEHQKIMAEAAAKQQPNGQSAAPAMEHNMPAGMSHEEHQKMMAEAAAKQQANGQSAAPAMEHNMPAGMSHEEHQKMMAEAAKKQNRGHNASSANQAPDHSNMQAGMDHKMPAGMTHEEHQKMMAAAATKHDGGQGMAAADQPMDHSNMPAGMSHNMPAGMSHEEHMKMMVEGTQTHNHHPGQGDSPDPRPEFRAIKSLTADEIQAYEEGTGHGLAKAAEQNHYPGPRHLLDLAKELQLSADQIQQIEKIKGSMSSAAIPTGKQLIENERKLNRLFAEKKIDKAQLDAVVAESATLEGKLRLIHLSAHLEVRKLLTSEQIDKYDELRGYKSTAKTSADAQHEHSMQ